MATRILPAVGDPDAARSIITLLSQLPDAEPLPPVVDSTQLLDTLARLAAESGSTSCPRSCSCTS